MADTLDAPIIITTASSIAESMRPASDELRLLSFSPNPLDREGIIRWSQGSGGDVSVHLIDAGGREVQQINCGYREQGEQSLLIETADLHSGIYFCEVRSGAIRLRGTFVVAR